MKNLTSILLVFSFLIISCNNNLVEEKRWPADKANDWYSQQNWIVGCNFIPSNAINQLEMWQEETFDPQTIDIELGYAQKLGFNSIRVYLHYLVWEQDPEGFKKRVDDFLNIAAKHNISTLFVLFDDCWNGDPKSGKQPDPIPGLHNSGWLQCPGQKQVTDSTLFPNYEKYVKDIISHFKNDNRIIVWNLYNEPGNSGHEKETLPLLKNVFSWAQQVRPSQPLTAGVWLLGNDFKQLNEFQINNSDIITFHNYGDVENMQANIDTLRKNGRPLICTEYMRRPINNFETHLPILKNENIGAYNWGLVSGKTQTIYPWDSWNKAYDSEPEIWFHDIFRQDGTPFDEEEVTDLKQIIAGTFLSPPAIHPKANIYSWGDTIQLSSFESANIKYTIDGSDPNERSSTYTGPIIVTENIVIKARAFKDKKQSRVASRKIKISDMPKPVYAYPFSWKYSGGGNYALIDGKRGSENFMDKEWQGFEGNDLNVTIDLGSVKYINRITATFLQVTDSWIFFPSSVEFAVSKDGRNFKSVSTIQNDLPAKEEEPSIKFFSGKFNIEQAQFVRVRAKNIHVCPDWHKGAGSKAWLFVDEIVVK